MKFLGSFTGKETEELVTKYTDIYGEILLGMDRKLKSLDHQLTKLKKHKQEPNFKKNVEKELTYIKNGLEQIETSIFDLEKRERQQNEKITQIEAKTNDLSMTLEVLKKMIQEVKEELYTVTVNTNNKFNVLKDQNETNYKRIMEFNKSIDLLNKEIMNVKNELQTEKMNFEKRISTIQTKQKSTLFSIGVIFILLIGWNLFLMFQ